MFILRKVVGNGVQINICLNKVYNLIDQLDKEEFEKTMALEEYYETERQKIYAFIVYNNGSEIIPLFKLQQNYIMMSDGKTFANLTFK